MPKANQGERLGVEMEAECKCGEYNWSGQCGTLFIRNLFQGLCSASFRSLQLGIMLRTAQEGKERTFSTCLINDGKERAQNKMCVFSAASPPKKHTFVLFGAAGGGPKKNILFRTRH